MLGSQAGRQATGCVWEPDPCALLWAVASQSPLCLVLASSPVSIPQGRPTPVALFVLQGTPLSHHTGLRALPN